MDGQSDYSRVSADAALQQLGSGKKGLSLLEAGKRLKQHGAPTLQHPPRLWIQVALGRSFHDVFFWILAVAVLVAVYLGDAHLILALAVALVLNILATMSFLRRGKKFVHHLDKLLETPASVLRSGKRLQVDASELVLGDIVYVTQGETVPADLRLLDTDHLVTDESNITGAHKHVSKAAKVSSQNLALFSSSVVAGSGRGVVVALGTRTMLGYKVNTVEKAMTYLASPADRQLAVVRKRTAQAASTFLIALIIFALASGLTLHEFASYAVLLTAALVPIGLAPILALLPSASAAPRTWLFRCALTDVSAKLTLVVIGIVVQQIFNVPVAITATQLVTLDVIVLLLPTLALGADEPRVSAGSKPFGIGFLAGAFAYANFLFFFERLGISPKYLDNQSTLYFRAAALTFLTATFCLFVYIKVIRADAKERFFTPYLWSNPKLFVGLTVALFLIIGSIYWPPAHRYVDTQNLTLADWLTALGAALLYFGANLLQRHTRQHTRQAVIELHQKLHSKSTA